MTVLLTLRADFLDRPLRYPEFGDLLATGTVMVATPGRDDLAEAIIRPASNVGVGLEPGLAEHIVGDIADQPGALPLLQYSLTELFASRRSDRLTLEGYQRSGGVFGALGRRAEQLYDELEPSGQEAARQVFLRLVSVDEAAQDTRRRIPRLVFRNLPLDAAAVDEVLDRYGHHRLLTSSPPRQPGSHGGSRHEALLSHWDRLRGWINERRDDLLVHRRLAEAADEWETSGQQPSFLVGGGRLEQFESLVASSDLAIGSGERDLIGTSRVAEDMRRDRRAAAAGHPRRVRAAALISRRRRIRLRQPTASGRRRRRGREPEDLGRAVC